MNIKLLNYLFAFLSKYHIDFMEFRLWIGVWVFVLLVILVVFNLSFMVKYITRFTEDCFATLVAIVFIFDAIKNVFKMRDAQPTVSSSPNFADFGFTSVYNSSTVLQTTSKSTYDVTTTIEASTVAQPKPAYKTQDDVYYLSVLLFLLSFFICTSLKGFRKKPFFPAKVRFCLLEFKIKSRNIFLSFYFRFDKL